MRKEERGVSRLGQGMVDCAKKEFRGNFKYLKSTLSSFLWTHILPHKPMCEAQVLEESDPHSHRCVPQPSFTTWGSTGAQSPRPTG